MAGARAARRPLDADLAWLAESRLKSGVPPRVTDPATIQHIAQLVLSPNSNTGDVQAVVVHDVVEPQSPREKRYAVYWHYDADDVLLYVGISDNPGGRSREHASTSIWVRFAVRHEGRWYNDKQEALAAERTAIAVETPLFNKKHAVYDERQVVQYLIAHNAVDLLQITRK